MQPARGCGTSEALEDKTLAQEYSLDSELKALGMPRGNNDNIEREEPECGTREIWGLAMELDEI
jgi:hypothetical protein